MKIMTRTVSVGPEPMEVALLRLCSDTIEVELSTLGAGLRGIYLPAKEGKRNILFRFEREEDYLSNDVFAGAVLCPNAGRIKDGKIRINGRDCRLSKNEGGSVNLHGGENSVSFKNWKIKKTEAGEGSASVVLTTFLEDGTDGYPGNREIECAYRLTGDDRLLVTIKAVSDQDTYLNLSVHPYFNLSGAFTGEPFHDWWKIRADRVVRNDAEHIPVHIVPVDGTAFDFRMGERPDKKMEEFPDEEIARIGGYNNAFVLSRGEEPDVICRNEESGYSVAMRSDAPTVVVYSGSHLSGSLTLEGGLPGYPCCAAAFEFQDYPNAPHLVPELFSITKAGREATRTICYQFGY